MSKIITAMDNHSGAITVGIITAITCGVATIMYKKFINHLEESWGEKNDFEEEES